MDMKDLMPHKPAISITNEQRKNFLGNITPQFNNNAMKQMANQLDKYNRDIERKREEERQANIETAENTAEMKQDLKEVIHNQNSYIKLLESQNNLLKNIFVSGEDGVAVQKEIMQIMQQQGNDNVFVDKALDAGVGTVMLAVQIWLKKHGIDF